MVGCQFSFFLAPEDQYPFEDMIRASGDIVFLKWWPKDPRAEALESSVVSSYGNEVLALLITAKKYMDEIKFTPVKWRNVFTCDLATEPVIEFSRCYVTNRFIRAGRLYRVDKYWQEDDRVITKPEDFFAWADHLYDIAKKSLVKIEQGCFAGAEALRLRQRGVAFEGLDVALGTIGG